MNVILGALGSLFGIGKDYLNNKAKLKQLKQEQEHEIIRAETESIVSRIKGNSESDNEIDVITARNKSKTFKDEVITYIFLVPIAVATITPFLVAYQNKDFIQLNENIRDSYISLDKLPDWYKYVLALVITDVLGFRSFLRKVVDKFIETKFSKDDKRNK